VFDQELHCPDEHRALVGGRTPTAAALATAVGDAKSIKTAGHFPPISTVLLFSDN
jgi:hypothetical protein